MRLGVDSPHGTIATPLRGQMNDFIFSTVLRAMRNTQQDPNLNNSIAPRILPISVEEKVRGLWLGGLGAWCHAASLALLCARSLCFVLACSLARLLACSLYHFVAEDSTAVKARPGQVSAAPRRPSHQQGKTQIETGSEVLSATQICAALYVVGGMRHQSLPMATPIR